MHHIYGHYRCVFMCQLSTRLHLKRFPQVWHRHWGSSWQALCCVRFFWRLNTFSHTSHLKSFRHRRCCTWYYIACLNANILAHWLHSYDFAVLCLDFMCSLSWMALGKIQWCSSHLYLLSFSWMMEQCFSNESFLPNDFPHVSHICCVFLRIYQYN